MHGARKIEAVCEDTPAQFCAGCPRETSPPGAQLDDLSVRGTAWRDNGGREGLRQETATEKTRSGSSRPAQRAKGIEGEESGKGAALQNTVEGKKSVG